ncbi:MAG: DMT family transporter [Pseudomonadota bacterium]
MTPAAPGKAQVPVLFWLCLLTFGAGWGLMQPLNKIAVGAGFAPWGIMAWQGLVTLAVAGALCAMRGIGLPRGRAQWVVAAQVAFLGTLMPHWATYTAVGVLPAGLMAILLATVPILALPLGAVLGQERVTGRRLLGLGLGLGAVAVIAGFRDGIAPGAGWAVAIALLAPSCYALNSTLLVRRGMAGLDPLQAFAGAACLFLPISVVVALATGQATWLFGPGQGIGSLAVLTIAVGHTLLYSGFLRLVTRAGSVFASQTAYLVTGFGVLWSVLLLGERYPAAVLAAGVMMVAGMAMVRPAERRA